MVVFYGARAARYGTTDGRLCDRSQTHTMPRRLCLVASPEQFIRQRRWKMNASASDTSW